MTTINSADLLRVLMKIVDIEREHSGNYDRLQEAYNEAASMGYKANTIRRILLYIERGGQTAGKYYKSRDL